MSGVLLAYITIIDCVFYLVVVFAIICGVFLWGMGWNDVRKKDGGGKGAFNCGNGAALNCWKHAN